MEPLESNFAEIFLVYPDIKKSEMWEHMIELPYIFHEYFLFLVLLYVL